MCHAPETLRDEIIIAAIKKLVENKEIKVILIDSAGNVISDISLSALRDALRGANNKDFSTLEADVESILAQMDIKLSELRDALRGTDNRTLTDLYKKAYDSTNDREKISIENDAVGLAKDSTLSSRLPREIELDDGTGAYDKLHRSGNALLIAINEDKIGLAKETTLSNILSQLDITLSALRDDLRGVDSRTLTDLYNKINDLLTELQPVSASDSVAAADNTAGLTVTLDKGGRPFVDVYYNVGGAADIYIEVSKDGSTWRPLDSVSPTSAEEKLLQYPWVGHRYVRVRVPTTGIDVELEITASR